MPTSFHTFLFLTVFHGILLLLLIYECHRHANFSSLGSCLISSIYPSAADLLLFNRVLNVIFHNTLSQLLFNSTNFPFRVSDLYLIVTK